MHDQLRRNLLCRIYFFLMIGTGGAGNLFARRSRPTGKISGRVLEAGTNQGLPVSMFFLPEP